MIKIIKNEIIKLYYRKKILLMITFMIIFALILLLALNFDKNEYAANKAENIIKSYEANIKATDDVKEKERLKSNVDSLSTAIDDFKQDQTDPDGWKQRLQEKNKKLYDSIDTNLPSDQKESIYQSIKLNEYHITNNIKPITTFGINGQLFFLQYLSFLGYGVLAFIIALVTGDSLSSEYSTGAIKLLLLRPVEKIKIFIGKFIANVIVVETIILIINFIIYIISSIIFGFSSFKYPIQISSKFVKSDILNIALNQYIKPVSDTSYIMTSGEYTIKAIILQLIFVISCISFYMMISTIFKNKLVSLSISIMFPLSINILSATGLFKNILKYTSLIFPSLGDPYSIISREIQYITGAYYIEYSVAIIILIFWSILFLSIGMVAANKKSEIY